MTTPKHITRIIERLDPVDREALERHLAGITEARDKAEHQAGVLGDEIETLQHELDRREARLDSLLETITPSTVDFVRCGIGANYSGENWEKKMDEVYLPFRRAVEQAREAK